MKTNLLYTLVGIVLGIFGFAVARQLQLGTLGSGTTITPNRLEQSTDLDQLKRQLELSQNRVRKLETLIGAASIANDKLNRIDRNDKNPNRIENLQELIDQAKPFIRALLEPEIEKALASGEFQGVGQFMRFADELGLSDTQRVALNDQFKALSRQRTEEFLEKLRDNETSLFGLMKESSEWENSLSPDIDAIYQENLSPEQFAQYEEKRLVEQTQRVADKADAQLDMLNNSIKDLSSSQQDQIYSIMARRSPYYKEEMEIQTESGPSPNQSPIESAEAMNTEIENVILPHQRDAWIQYKRRQDLLSGITGWAN
ncbi:MAG: hypothetical protein AAFY98_05200 [Verrucomicrobiota bacterium]